MAALDTSDGDDGLVALRAIGEDEPLVDPNAETFELDLGAGRRLVATHYALQHGGHRSARRLRNWVLEASNTPHALAGAAALDARQWTTLAEHVDDEGLRDGEAEDGAAFASALWELD